MDYTFDSQIDRSHALPAAYGCGTGMAVAKGSAVNVGRASATCTAVDVATAVVAGDTVAVARRVAAGLAVAGARVDRLAAVGVLTAGAALNTSSTCDCGAVALGPAVGVAGSRNAPPCGVAAGAAAWAVTDCGCVDAVTAGVVCCVSTNRAIIAASVTHDTATRPIIDSDASDTRRMPRTRVRVTAAEPRRATVRPGVS